MDDFFRYPGSSFEDRINWIKAIIIFLIFIVLLRALHLQVVEHDNLNDMANNLAQKAFSTDIQRGSIYDSDGNAIAVSVPVGSVFAYAEKVKDAELTATILSIALEQKISPEIFKNKKGFMWIKRYITDEQKEFIEKQKIEGVYITHEFSRVYPRETFAAQLVGITGYDSTGLDGLEYRFDSYLMGKYKDVGGGKNVGNLFRGADLHLTISEKIQFYTEKALRKSVLATHSKSGIAIVMESRTGAILAVASYPTFNPNSFTDYEQSLYVNRAVNNAYEPGSTFKIITLSIAREKGFIQPHSVFDCEKGRTTIMDRNITDVRPYGIMGLKNIIKYSSNICSLKIGLTIPKEIFYDEIKNFGFGAKTGVDLPGESAGVLHDHKTWSKLDQAAISFGHSIQVSPIQLVSAINTVANKGVYLSPHTIKKIVSPDGQQLYSETKQNRRVISEAVANEITRYMVAVTEKKGTGYAANIKGIPIAGKTGTTKKLDPKKKGYSNKHHIRSFVGFLPADSPKLTILAMLNEPREKYKNSLSAAPLFKDIAVNSYRYFIKEQVADFKPQQEIEEASKRFLRYPELVKSSKDLKNKSLREVLYYSSFNKKKLRVKGQGKVKSYSVNNEKISVEFD